MFDTISNIKDLIMDVFRNTGQYCSDIIDASLKCFNALVNAGSKMLSYKVENTTFSDLWAIINLVARIMGGVASALIVLFFLYNLMDDSLENRPDQGLTILVKNFSSIFIYIQISYIIPSILQILAGMQDSMMLDFCCNDMSPMYSIGFCRTF